MQSFLINLIFLFSFFPFLRLIPGVEAEVQPLGALLAIAFLVRYGVRLDRTFFAVMWLMATLAIFSGVMIIRGGPIMPVGLQCIAYILPLVTFLALRDHTAQLSVRVFYAALGIHTAVGLLQAANLLGWAAPLFQVLVGRFHSAAIGGDRGVALLTPEPAYGGTMIVLIAATAIYFAHAGRISRRACWYLAGVTGLLLAINKSGTGFALIMMMGMGYLMASFWKLPLQTKLLRIAGGMIGAIGLLWLINTLIDEYAASTRILMIFRVMRDLLFQASDVSEATLAAIAGKRFLTVWIGYVAMWDNYGLGRGIASYILDFWDVSTNAGIYWVDNVQLAQTERVFDYLKPDAYGASLAMDTGLLGFGLLVLLVYYVTRLPVRWRAAALQTKNNHWKLRSAILWAALFMIFLNCTTALPVPWVMLAYLGAWWRPQSEDSI